MADKLNEIFQLLEGDKKEFISLAAKAKNKQELIEVRARFLGRKGRLARYFDLLATADAADKPVLGKNLNQYRGQLEEEYTRHLTAMESARQGEEVDFTLPGIMSIRGSKHPLLHVLDRIKDIFYAMGFTVEEGPEIEDEYHNFEALNIPENHPSRDLQDTLYLCSGDLLRTHTSPVQIRTMESQKPPIRMIAPGRCYRKDTPDATHSPVFYQVEGLYVDEGVSFADLKGVIQCFAQRLFGSDIRIRFRPSFFPFTEPSAEYDFSCIMCHGKGCRVCKGTGWLEISGAGMVDPAVFQFVGYDAERYTGYAFGMGVERIAMLLLGVHDIRLFYENDLRFLNQFNTVA